MDGPSIFVCVCRPASMPSREPFAPPPPNSFNGEIFRCRCLSTGPVCRRPIVSTRHCSIRSSSYRTNLATAFAPNRRRWRDYSRFVACLKRPMLRKTRRRFLRASKRYPKAGSRRWRVWQRRVPRRAIGSHIETITTLTGDATAADAAQPEAYRERLRKLVAELLDTEASLPEESLAHEVALLVGKSDVREELDRLKAHVAAAHDLIFEGAAVGRRFDFLCQEFNRESNTLCSKSSDVALTQIGLKLKAAVEQLREQIQNVE